VSIYIELYEKESILNCLLMGKRSFIYKSKGGIGSRNIRPLRRGQLIGGKIKSGSENNSSLFR